MVTYATKIREDDDNRVASRVEAALESRIYEAYSAQEKRMERPYAFPKNSFMKYPGADESSLGGFRLVDYLPYHLTVASNQVSRLIAKAYQVRYGISIWQWRVLCTIGTEGPMTAQDVVSLSAMDKVAVSRAIQVLRKRGIVQRLRSKRDSRAYDLQLTTHGRAMYDDIITIALDYQDKLLSGFPAGDKDTLITLLQAIAGQAKVLSNE